MLTFHIISIFPESFDSYFKTSIIGRALKDGKIEVCFYNPKEYSPISNNPELREPIDDKPFGGGPGMVLKAQPFLTAIETVLKKIKKDKYEIIYFSPKGEKFDNFFAEKIAEKERKEGDYHLILVSGRYEGIDSRVEEIYPGKRISVGDYVLTGGELAVMILIDVISRRIDGVLGNKESLEEERVSSAYFYTRPAELEWKGKKYKIPEVLKSGNHKKIEEWRKENNK